LGLRVCLPQRRGCGIFRGSPVPEGSTDRGVREGIRNWPVTVGASRPPRGWGWHWVVPQRTAKASSADRESDTTASSAPSYGSPSMPVLSSPRQRRFDWRIDGEGCALSPVICRYSASTLVGSPKQPGVDIAGFGTTPDNDDSVDEGGDKGPGGDGEDEECGDTPSGQGQI
ncbi:unnamed protein product, partial [Ectocarpus sp. 4 AP-2014]